MLFLFGVSYVILRPFRSFFRLRLSQKNFRTTLVPTLCEVFCMSASLMFKKREHVVTMERAEQTVYMLFILMKVDVNL